MRWFFLWAWCAVFGAGCFAVADVDRFECGCACADTTQRRDLEVSIEGLGGHQTDMFRFHLVRQRNTELLVAGAIDGFTDNDVDNGAYVYVPDALPEDNGAMPLGNVYRFHLFADDATPGYQGTEETWATEQPVCATGLHETSTRTDAMTFDRPNGIRGRTQDFSLTLEAMDTHVNETIDVLVVEIASAANQSDEVVGFHRVSVLPSVAGSPNMAAPYVVFLPGIVAPGRQYLVEFFADHDESGDYSGAGPDHSWSRSFTADATGVNATFVHTGRFDELTFF